MYVSCVNCLTCFDLPEEGVGPLEQGLLACTRCGASLHPPQGGLLEPQAPIPLDVDQAILAAAGRPFVARAVPVVPGKTMDDLARELNAMMEARSPEPARVPSMIDLDALHIPAPPASGRGRPGAKGHGESGERQAEASHEVGREQVPRAAPAERPAPRPSGAAAIEATPTPSAQLPPEPSQVSAVTPPPAPEPSQVSAVHDLPSQAAETRPQGEGTGSQERAMEAGRPEPRWQIGVVAAVLAASVIGLLLYFILTGR